MKANFKKMQNQKTNVYEERIDVKENPSRNAKNKISGDRIFCKANLVEKQMNPFGLKTQSNIEGRLRQYWAFVFKKRKVNAKRFQTHKDSQKIKQRLKWVQKQMNWKRV